MIATGRQSASTASVPTIRKGLLHARLARAGLRRAARVNLHQPPTSLFRFVGEHRDELGPSRIVNGLRQHSTSEPLHIQVFDSDHAVSVHQLARFLLLKVAALIRYMGVRAL